MGENAGSLGQIQVESCAQTDPMVPIPNFRRVTPWLMRGGQPDEEGIAALKELGVQTIISLRWANRHINPEREIVARLGMKFISFRLAYWIMPSEETIAEFLSLIDDQANHPVFVHCLHGADRTGLLCAIFRMARQGWTIEEAYKEMKLCGYHRFRVRNFKWMLWRYARRHCADLV